MNKITIFILFFTLNSVAQSNGAKYWLDPEGNEVNHHIMELVKKYPDNTMGFKKTIDSGLIFQFNNPKYETFQVEYSYIKKALEEITFKTYNDSTVFLISFFYLDDTCSDWHSNKMTRSLISSLKEKIYNGKGKLEKNNIKVICLFENGITLQNTIENQKEYFYSDSNSFFRKNLFLHPSLCGTFGLIKPNGQTLIRNGEYDIFSMNEHLKPKIWNLIFNKE